MAAFILWWGCGVEVVGSVGVLYSLLLMLAMYSTFSLGKDGSICVMNMSTSFASSLICFARVRLLSDIELSGGGVLPRHSRCDCRLGGCLRGRRKLAGHAYFICFSGDEGGLRGAVGGVGAGCRGKGALLVHRIGPGTFGFGGPRRWSFSCRGSSVSVLNDLLFLLL